MSQTESLKMASLSSTVAVGAVVLLCVAFVNEAYAQAVPAQSANPQGGAPSKQQEFATLGQLLNAGGKLLGPQEFKEEVVQRMLVGTLPSGATVEIMYASSGALAGSLLFGGQGNTSGYDFGRRGAPQNWPVSGNWRVDDSERICTSLRITGAQGSTIIPARCEFWFKVLNTYYVSESDEDRSAKIIARSLKQ